MRKQRVDHDDKSLGLHDRSVTRRDFVGGTILGAGAALLGMAAPSVLRAAEAPSARDYPVLGPDWTGPGGIGDYSRANGNTHEVVNAAHSIWQGRWKEQPTDAIDAGEFDMVVVGGGFSGLGAAHTYYKEGKGTCLLLDNHAIFGGEAKQNEMVVDGHHLHAPQGSHAFAWPQSHRIWKEIGLPSDYDELRWQREASGTKTKLRIPDDSYIPLLYTTREADVGFFYKDPSAPKGHRWVKNPWANGFRDAPLPDAAKLELMRMEHFEYRKPLPENWRQWMDSMTYKEFLQKEVGVTRKEVFQYLDPMVASSMPGLGSDVISAYGATIFPGASAIATAAGEGWDPDGDEEALYACFPGGNGSIARFIVRTMIPDAIAGKHTLHDVVYGKVDWKTLDREGQKIRMRLGSTVVRVEHAGSAGSASRVLVTYLNGDKVYRVKAKGVVMAGGQWINRHVVKDAPEPLIQAMKQFHHGPILTVNVGVRHWRFLETLGISLARWFEHEGIGWSTGIRAPMVIEGRSMPLDPGKPTVLTLYIPFTYAVSQTGMPLEVQSLTARNELFSMSFKQIERKIREQLTVLFGDYGFDPKKDIAGIIANRWGHAFIITGPGFFFGRDGKPAPREVVRKGYGRVRFGNSELTGFQLWTTACDEGERAAREAIELAT